MIRAMSLTLSLLIPMASLADEKTAAHTTDQPTVAATPAALVPAEVKQPTPAVAEAHQCGMHGCCGAGMLKWVFITGVAATVITGVVVGIAAGASRQTGTQVR